MKCCIELCEGCHCPIHTPACMREGHQLRWMCSSPLQSIDEILSFCYKWIFLQMVPMGLTIKHPSLPYLYVPKINFSQPLAPAYFSSYSITFRILYLVSKFDWFRKLYCLRQNPWHVSSSEVSATTSSTSPCVNCAKFEILRPETPLFLCLSFTFQFLHFSSALSLM
jgi:hypothetical protein